MFKFMFTEHICSEQSMECRTDGLCKAMKSVKLKITSGPDPYSPIFFSQCAVALSGLRNAMACSDVHYGRDCAPTIQFSSGQLRWSVPYPFKTRRSSHRQVLDNPVFERTAGIGHRRGAANVGCRRQQCDITAGCRKPERRLRVWPWSGVKRAVE